jgi:hypothetical protein
MSNETVRLTPSVYKDWKSFKSEDIRFLGFGEPHVPELEERLLHAYLSGRRDESLTFSLPDDVYIAAIDITEERE